MPRIHPSLPHPANHAAFTYSGSGASFSLPIGLSKLDPAGNGTSQRMLISRQHNMTTPSAANQNAVIQQLQRASASTSPSEINLDRYSSSPPSGDTKSNKPSELTFDAFGAELRLHRLQEAGIEILKQQQRTLQQAVALSARLSRTLAQVQGGLVETLKNSDKAGFANAYHTSLDLKDAASSLWKRGLRSPDPSHEDGAISSHQELDSPSFMDKLPAGSAADVLDFIHLLRNSSSFLVDRIRRLNPSQISALASSPKKHSKDSIFSSVTRGTSQASQQKRNAAFSNSLRDTAWSLERTTPISALLFNMYSALPGPDSIDYRVRLDTWSSTCASLYSHSDQAYHYLLIEVLNAFASLHDWRAKPRIDLFLMNLLQTGAFLLEPVEDNLASNDFPFPVSDPLRTREAEDFFDHAVGELFEILNDSDGGLPFGALHFGSAVLGKLSQAEKQSSFRGFLLYTWYFCEFLFSAIIMPETKGMLLHYHVSKSARENILKEVAIRAQSRVAEFLDPTLNPTPLLPAMRAQLEQMVSCLIEIQVKAPTFAFGSENTSPVAADMRPGCLVLSISDILLLIDMLVPQPPPNPTPWDPFLNSSATAFAAQYRQSLPPLSKIFPAEHTHGPGTAQNAPAISQPSATALLRKFDQVRHDLHAVMERKDVYPLPPPGQDSWALIELDSTGKPVIGRLLGEALDCSKIPSVLKPIAEIRRFPHISGQNLDPVQRASLRLVDEQDRLTNTPKFNFGTDQACQTKVPLERLFAVELELAEANADGRNARYWWTASRVLRKKYPLSVLAANDTRILLPILLMSRQSHYIVQQQTQIVEAALRHLAEACDHISMTTSDVLGRLDRLRDKMWYLADITNSNIYEVTKNVAQALRNMVSPGSTLDQPSSPSIRGRKKPRSLAESILREPEAQTMSIMKAPFEQGGPKKLADEQVEMTKRWFQRCGVDNFCRGEERIHRFCMEIRTAARKLVGESMLESPVLWSSDLYFRQRTFVDGLVTRSMPASTITRPSSILSEEGPATYAQTHQGLRGFENAARPQLFDRQSSPGRKSSFHSLGSDRWRTARDTYGADVLSIADSPGRAVSATTADSIKSFFWSPLPTQPQSTASVSSLQSRPPSFINDTSGLRPVEQNVPRRVNFFDELRQRVVSLLLSDLGSPVWSCGSETDAWLADVLQQNRVRWELHKRESVEGLLGKDATFSSLCRKAGPLSDSISSRHRSTSSGSSVATAPKPRTDPSASTEIGKVKPDNLDDPDAGRASLLDFSYQSAYEDLMKRFSRQADPILKLDILDDLKSLVVSSIREDRLCRVVRCGGDSDEVSTTTLAVNSAPSSRRNSWVAGSLSGSAPSRQQHSNRANDIEAELTETSDPAIDEGEVVSKIKSVLMTTRPKTLFRDLQFITAFVPSDVLNKSAGGKAFLHVGLAALAFKDDVCRSLVSVANKTMMDDNVKGRSPTPENGDEYTPRDAAQLWILAAKEGNATAQRELATLYLSSPEHLPSVSFPLTAPREIFKSEMKYWPEDGSKRPLSQAMCLALHWMRLAAGNGDAVAKERLKERDAQGSIRNPPVP